MSIETHKNLKSLGCIINIKLKPLDASLEVLPVETIKPVEFITTFFKSRLTL